MGFLIQEPTKQQIVEMRQVLIRALADFVDSRGNQILDILRAKEVVERMKDHQVYNANRLIESWVESETAPFRIFYDEDIKEFRKTYFEILSEKNIDIDSVNDAIAKKYTDDYILECLKHAEWACICVANDLKPYFND